VLFKGGDDFVSGTPGHPHERRAESFRGAVGEGDLIGVRAEHARRHGREPAIPLAVLDVGTWHDAPLLELAASGRIGSLKGHHRNRAVRASIEVARGLHRGQLRPQSVDFRIRCPCSSDSHVLSDPLDAARLPLVRRR
jgi:hypothetical protein